MWRWVNVEMWWGMWWRCGGVVVEMWWRFVDVVALWWRCEDVLGIWDALKICVWLVEDIRYKDWRHSVYKAMIVLMLPELTTLYSQQSFLILWNSPTIFQKKNLLSVLDFFENNSLLSVLFSRYTSMDCPLCKNIYRIYSENFIFLIFSLSLYIATCNFSYMYYN